MLIERYYAERKWEINQPLSDLIGVLGAWADDDPFFETCELGREHNLMLGKSILLAGSVGGSKTTVMEALAWALRQKGSYLAFDSHKTLKLATAYQAEKGGGMDALTSIKKGSLAHPRHTYYDEFGKVEIAQFVHFGKPVNIDRLVIEVREALFVQSGYMTHGTTNMTEAGLREWLTEKYYSRLTQIMNIIPYDNPVDYRRSTRPQRRVPDGAPSADDLRLLNEAARDKAITLFVSEALLYLSNGEPLSLSNELLVYDSLVEVGAITEHKKLTDNPLYAKALEKAALSLTMERSNLDVKDKHKAAELAELLRQCVLGVAHTSMLQARILVAFKKTVVREFVRVNMDTREKIYKMFPKEG